MGGGTAPARQVAACRFALGLALWLVLGLSQPTAAFIERLTPLGDLLEDSDYVFVARTESVSGEKSLAAFSAVEDLKGRTPFRTLRVQLTGDKEKHVPHLLKRIAPQVPVVFFLTRVDKQWLGLGYTEGTWFQIIGKSASETVQWHFTHCEIYLRRTFKGSTSELVQVIREVQSGQRKPPPPNPKEPPGFGPELPPNKPSTEHGRGNSSASVHHGGLTPAALDSVNHGGLIPAAPALQLIAALEAGTPYCLGGGYLLAVILLPPLAGLLAPLISLLFPGVLLAVWRQYRLLVYVLLVQSTLVVLQTVLGWWYPSAWWLAPRYWWWPTVILFALGLLIGMTLAHRQRSGLASADPELGSATGSGVQRPVRLEWWALITLLVVGIGWGVWAWSRYGSAWDQMTPLTVGSAVGLAHLMLRSLCRPHTTVARWSTGQVILVGMLLCGVGLAWREWQESAPWPAPVSAATRTEETWPQYRGNPERTGCPTDSTVPRQPRILWRCDVSQGRGRFYVHSTPTVLGDCAYVGVLHEIQGQTRGYLVCVSLAERQAAGRTLPAGTVLWRFDADGTLKPVFASPTLRGGRLYFGEGYHQDRDCRLFCLEASSGRMLWQYATHSHIESTPALVEVPSIGGASDVAGNAERQPISDTGMIVVGVGEEGLLALEERLLTNEVRLAWKIPHWHVDGSPLVVAGHVYCGSLLGDSPMTQTPFVAAFRLSDGRTLWRIESPLPVSASLTWADGKILVPLGNGKINADANPPRGGILALQADTGRRIWQFDNCGPVFSTPAVRSGRVYFGSKDGWLRCLNAESGELVWSQPLDAAIVACPAIAEDVVVAVSVRGTLYAFDAATGQVRWRLDELVADAPNQDVYSSPVLYRGRIYLGVGRYLVCLGEEK